MTEGEARSLLEAALAGDGAALAKLVALLSPVVHHRVAVVLSRLGRAGGVAKQEAKDLTQEVLLQLFRDQGRLLRTWDPARGASLTHFVGLVAQRRAISLLRGARTETPLGDSLDEIERVPAPATPPPDAQAASREHLRLLLARLQAVLSPLGLELFYRLFVHEESVEQIGAATGLTPNAIYIWRNRLIKLCHKLDADLRTASAAEATPGGALQEEASG
jgi:DNA-directed RNA polymerase specialized sigma24 family protein